MNILFFINAMGFASNCITLIREHMTAAPPRSRAAAPVGWLPRILPLAIWLLLTAVAPAWAAPLVQPVPREGAIAVIYPDIGEPYRSIFMQIIEGIEDRAKVQVARYTTVPNMGIGELNNTLRRQDTKVVIALGRQGMKAASTLDRNIGVVVGGVLTVPENEIRDQPLNSLSPDPAAVLAPEGIMPRRGVFYVYDPPPEGG